MLCPLYPVMISQFANAGRVFSPGQSNFQEANMDVLHHNVLYILYHILGHIFWGYLLKFIPYITYRYIQFRFLTLPLLKNCLSSLTDRGPLSAVEAKVWNILKPVRSSSYGPIQIPTRGQLEIAQGVVSRETGPPTPLQHVGILVICQFLGGLASSCLDYRPLILHWIHVQQKLAFQSFGWV